ncbi:MAG TPA: hypothetical protein VFH31_14520 [Pyrinomonadaceae bacterium]|nr:hypothetical protein [Pyrinomonadaceae bacterium]
MLLSMLPMLGTGYTPEINFLRPVVFGNATKQFCKIVFGLACLLNKDLVLTGYELHLIAYSNVGEFQELVGKAQTLTSPPFLNFGNHSKYVLIEMIAYVYI